MFCSIFLPNNLQVFPCRKCNLRKFLPKSKLAHRLTVKCALRVCQGCSKWYWSWQNTSRSWQLHSIYSWLKAAGAWGDPIPKRGPLQILQSTSRLQVLHLLAQRTLGIALSNQLLPPVLECLIADTDKKFKTQMRITLHCIRTLHYVRQTAT